MVESTDVSAFPAEVIDVKTGVEEPPVAVQATAPFLPAAEKEIVRNVTEKRLLHRVFIATQSPHRIRTWSYELPDGMSSLMAAKVSTRNSPQKKEIVRDVTEKRLLH